MTRAMVHLQRPLAGLTRDNCARELFAGVTLLAFSVPLNIGYAQIAGLPATAGLYALIASTLVCADGLVATSGGLTRRRRGDAGVLVAHRTGRRRRQLRRDGGGAGDPQRCAVRARLGAQARIPRQLLSKPILVGFVGGLALEILVSQLAKMLGVQVDSSGEFLEKAVELFGSLGDVNLWSLGISAVALALLVGRSAGPGGPVGARRARAGEHRHRAG